MVTVSMIFISAASLAAQERLLATYGTELGPEDYFNSSGVRLNSMAAIIAQDRANFHRFGIRHGSDRSDTIFDSRAARAQISKVPVTICCGLEEHVTKGYDRDYSPFVAISVFGQNGQITRLHIEVPG